MEQIKNSIYYETSYLGVTLGALIFSQGTIMIDAPLRPEDARSWRSALLNQRGGTNRMLITLDAHLDRTLGARALESTIIAHQRTAQVFRSRPNIFKGQSPEYGADWESYAEAIGTRWAAPDITFSQQMVINWGGPAVVLTSQPGPAMGAIWVAIPDESIAFIGDTVLLDQPPFLGTAELPAWLEGLEILAKDYRDYILIGGRNGPIPIKAVDGQRKVLQKIYTELEKLAAQKAPPEEITGIVPAILKSYTFPAAQREKYQQRLEAGLIQCYQRQYSPTSIQETAEAEDDEE